MVFAPMKIDHAPLRSHPYARGILKHGRRRLGTGLEPGHAFAGSVPVHSSDGDLPTAEDGERRLSSRVPVR
jgi:hypothetical protein